MLKYTVSNMDFTKLTAEIMINMKAAVTDGVLTVLRGLNMAGVGGSYTSDDIVVVLKSGSVVAEVTVTPKGETAAKLQSNVAVPSVKTSLETNVQEKVVAVPDLATALVDGAALTDVSTSSVAATQVTGTAATSTGTTGTSTTSTTGNEPVSSGAVAINVAFASFLATLQAF